MAIRTVKFSKDGIQEKLASGDTLYILPHNEISDRELVPTISVSPDATAIVSVEQSFTPKFIVGNDPSGANVYYQPWPIGPVDTSSTRKWDTITGAFSALKFTCTGGKCTIDLMPSTIAQLNGSV